jgi:3-phosphoshikimate 1-carboxyvinyltransferase
MLVEWIGSDVRIHPGGPLTAGVELPGSKSLTNRFLACTALADGLSVLRRASLSDDAQRMIEALQRLGIRVDADEAGRRIEVHGCCGQLPSDEAELDAGHAGTAMRFLTALVCLGYGRYRLDGSPRMRQRPIGPLVEALRVLGARVEYEQEEGFPPLVVHARGLTGGLVVFDSPPSSQFISALLMAAPYAADDVLIRVEGTVVSEPYVDLTLHVMRTLGVEAVADAGPAVSRAEGRLTEAGGARYIVPAPQRYQAANVEIEPDASAATYFWAAAAATGGRIRVRGLSRDSAQGDVGFVDVLEQMGCGVAATADGLEVTASPAGRLRGVTVDLGRMPDTVQTLAVLALLAEGPTEIRGAANLRIKETDRLEALKRELSRLGAEVELLEDGLRITPPRHLRSAAVETYDDHRMAMSFAVAGLASEGVVIRDAGCVSKSFPSFFETLDGLLHER